MLGGYAIALAVHRGLRVIADAKPEDEGLVRSFGAHEIVPRGDDIGARLRAATGDGVDGLVDGALQGGTVLAGVRDGGRIAAVRAFRGERERGRRGPPALRAGWCPRPLRHHVLIGVCEPLDTRPAGSI